MSDMEQKFRNLADADKDSVLLIVGELEDRETRQLIAVLARAPNV